MAVGGGAAAKEGLWRWLSNGKGWIGGRGG